MTEIFVRDANTSDEGWSDLAGWWDAVESGGESEPFCCICDTIIPTRAGSVEVFFRNDFRTGETVDDNPDFGLAAHKTCTESNFTIIEKW